MLSFYVPIIITGDLEASQRYTASLTRSDNNYSWSQAYATTMDGFGYGSSGSATDSFRNDHSSYHETYAENISLTSHSYTEYRTITATTSTEGGAAGGQWMALSEYNGDAGGTTSHCSASGTNYTFDFNNKHSGFNSGESISATNVTATDTDGYWGGNYTISYTNGATYTDSNSTYYTTYSVGGSAIDTGTCNGRYDTYSTTGVSTWTDGSVHSTTSTTSNITVYTFGGTANSTITSFKTYVTSYELTGITNTAAYSANMRIFNKYLDGNSFLQAQIQGYATYVFDLNNQVTPYGGRDNDAIYTADAVSAVDLVQNYFVNTVASISYIQQYQYVPLYTRNIVGATTTFQITYNGTVDISVPTVTLLTGLTVSGGPGYNYHTLTVIGTYNTIPYPATYSRTYSTYNYDPTATGTIYTTQTVVSRSLVETTYSTTVVTAAYLQDDTYTTTATFSSYTPTVVWNAIGAGYTFNILLAVTETRTYTYYGGNNQYQLLFLAPPDTRSDYNYDSGFTINADKCLAYANTYISKFNENNIHALYMHSEYTMGFYFPNTTGDFNVKSSLSINSQVWYSTVFQETTSLHGTNVVTHSQTYSYRSFSASSSPFVLPNGHPYAWSGSQVYGFAPYVYIKSTASNYTQAGLSYVAYTTGLSGTATTTSVGKVSNIPVSYTSSGIFSSNSVTVSYAGYASFQTTEGGTPCIYYSDPRMYTWTDSAGSTYELARGMPIMTTNTYSYSWNLVNDYASTNTVYSSTHVILYSYTRVSTRQGGINYVYGGVVCGIAGANPINNGTLAVSFIGMVDTAAFVATYFDNSGNSLSVATFTMGGSSTNTLSLPSTQSIAIVPIDIVSGYYSGENPIWTTVYPKYIDW